jgi:hypothetical protein
MLSIIPAFPWFQGDCRENGLDKREIQNEGQMPCFSPAFG